MVAEAAAEVEGVVEGVAAEEVEGVEGVEGVVAAAVEGVEGVEGVVAAVVRDRHQISCTSPWGLLHRGTGIECPRR